MYIYIYVYIYVYVYIFYTYLYIYIYIGSSVCLLQIVLALIYPAFQEKPLNEKEMELEIVERYGENISEKSNKDDSDTYVSARDSPVHLTNRQRNATLLGLSARKNTMFMVPIPENLSDPDLQELEENTQMSAEVVSRKRAPTYVQKIFLGVESYSNKEYIEPEMEAEQDETSERNRAASYFPGGEYFEQVHKQPVLSVRERAETRAVDEYMRARSATMRARSQTSSQGRDQSGRDRTFSSYGNIYIYIYMNIYVHMERERYICKYVCMYVWMHLTMYIYMYVYIYICCILSQTSGGGRDWTFSSYCNIHIYIYIYVCVYVCIYVYIHIYVCIHMSYMKSNIRWEGQDLQFIW
jgi:hypothetical protein